MIRINHLGCPKITLIIHIAYIRHIILNVHPLNQLSLLKLDVNEEDIEFNAVFWTFSNSLHQ